MPVRRTVRRPIRRTVKRPVRRSNPRDSRHGVYVKDKLAYVSTKKMDANKAAAKLKASGRAYIKIKQVRPNPITGKLPKVGWRKEFAKAAYSAVKAPAARRKRASTTARIRRTRERRRENPRRWSSHKYKNFILNRSHKPPKAWTIEGVPRKRFRSPSEAMNYIDRIEPGSPLEPKYFQARKRNAPSVLLRANPKRRRNTAGSTGFTVRMDGRKSDVSQHRSLEAARKAAKGLRDRTGFATIIVNSSTGKERAIYKGPNSRGALRLKANPSHFRGKLGTGTRFDNCVRKVSKTVKKRKGQTRKQSAEAICASIGRKKYGKRKMTRMAVKGRRKSNPARRKRVAARKTTEGRRCYGVYCGQNLAYAGKLKRQADSAFRRLDARGRRNLNIYELKLPTGAKLGWRKAYKP